MPRDADEVDFFVSYARSDNRGPDGQRSDRDGWITRFIEELLADHRKFNPRRTLKPFFDQHDIRGRDDWRKHPLLPAPRAVLDGLGRGLDSLAWRR